MEQSTPQSNSFPEMMSATAFGISAVRSMNAGTLPEPTPNAGFPELYAARTIGFEPVASMTAVSLCLMSSFVPSIVGVESAAMRCFGAPAFSAASRMTFIASSVQREARGWGLATMALRALTAMIDLNITVDVGFVEGISAATTPIGSAIVKIWRSRSSAMTPTVFRSRIDSQMRRVANSFFVFLSSGFPNPVSSEARRPSRAASANPASAIACATRSTCSWE